MGVTEQLFASYAAVTQHIQTRTYMHVARFGDRKESVSERKKKEKKNIKTLKRGSQLLVRSCLCPATHTRIFSPVTVAITAVHHTTQHSTTNNQYIQMSKWALVFIYTKHTIYSLPSCPGQKRTSEPKCQRNEERPYPTAFIIIIISSSQLSQLQHDEIKSTATYWEKSETTKYITSHF